VIIGITVEKKIGISKLSENIKAAIPRFYLELTAKCKFY
jgi:hypothetical protein